MSSKEYELHNTRQQYRVGCYRNQSNMLGALYEQLRQGIDPDHLDCLLQRRDDRPIHLASARDPEFRAWIDQNIQLEAQLRIEANTDVMGLFEYIMYDLKHAPVCSDDPSNAAVFDYTRYICTVSDGNEESSARGATETEATTKAFLAYKRGERTHVSSS
jgi:hypothetical protein